MTDAPTRIYLDANVLIGMVERVEDLTLGQLALLKELDAGTLLGVTSELSLAEVMVVPLARNDDELCRAYLGLLRPHGALDVVPVSRETLLEAARLRSVTKMKLPDAIHVATAAMSGATAFVSADRGIRLPRTMRRLLWDALADAETET